MPLGQYLLDCHFGVGDDARLSVIVRILSLLFAVALCWGLLCLLCVSDVVVVRVCVCVLFAFVLVLIRQLCLCVVVVVAY